MKIWIRALLNFISTLMTLGRPGGVRALAAENVALRHELLILKRTHKGCIITQSSDRFLLGFLNSFVSPSRL